MNPESVINLGQHALTITALLSAPLLLAALIVGVVIGMLQAATQINEATLSFIPKLVVVTSTLLTIGHWMLQTLMDYTRALFQSIPAMIG